MWLTTAEFQKFIGQDEYIDDSENEWPGAEINDTVKSLNINMPVGLVDTMILTVIHGFIGDLITLYAITTLKIRTHFRS